MEVTVKLFATLREGRFKQDTTEIQNNGRVLDVLEKYDLQQDDVAICMVNGRDVDNEHTLKDGDTVSLFPPVGGG